MAVFRHLVGLAWAAACVGCGFELVPGGQPGVDASPTGDGVDAPDGPIDAPAVFDLAHVTPAVEQTINGTANIMWTSGVTINTTLLTTSAPLPAGAALRAVAQEGGGPEVALLELRSLIASGRITVVGTRPLIIYAASEIQLMSTLDASAQGPTAGSGARSGGAGFGLMGTHAGTYADGGGGGGSFGTQGNVGGNATEGGVTGTGGVRGLVYGDPQLTFLEGGSSGGPGLPLTCVGPVAGAGGGAIQLSAPTIAITGVIDAGGGGGGGGITCPGNVGSAGGGGSGGAIYVQAFALSGSGTLAANGGAGGSGSNWGGSVGAYRIGERGQDATLGANAASGGAAQPTDGGRGGDGAAAAPPQAGASVTSVYPNGGGGGGGHGRIVIDVPDGTTITLGTTPMYVRK